MGGFIRVTADLIARGSTRGAGWTRAQTEILGEPWPLQAGWRQRAVGRMITADAARAFLTTAKTRQRRRDRAKPPVKSGEISRPAWEAVCSAPIIVRDIAGDSTTVPPWIEDDCACPLCHGDGALYPADASSSNPFEPCALCFGSLNCEKEKPCTL